MWLDTPRIDKRKRFIQAIDRNDRQDGAKDLSVNIKLEGEPKWVAETAQMRTLLGGNRRP